MSSRHSAPDPAPWRAVSARLRPGIILIHAADDRLVAVVFGIANSRIVAAAPEVLDGARTLTDWWARFRRGAADPAALIVQLRDGDQLAARLNSVIARVVRTRR